MNPRRANPGRTAVSAFTLIELMVVIGLMMIILAIGVPKNGAGQPVAAWRKPERGDGGLRGGPPAGDPHRQYLPGDDPGRG